MAMNSNASMPLRISLPFTTEAAIEVLGWGASPEASPYRHKDIAEWCDRYWCVYMDVDAPPVVEKLLPILADVDAQWELYLVNTYTLDELSSGSSDSARLPVEWFEEWLCRARLIVEGRSL